MNFEKINFKNTAGYELSGRLELPADRHPHSYAVFAHCFTCSKNFSATKNITRAMTSAGFGVLRFDFTGLGDSDGDFADSNFSGNVDDLLAAIDYLKEHYKAPSLLVGHSLGGAAVIYASAKADSIKAVATVGAPSDTKHVRHLFGDQLDAIVENGEATVQLSGRPFKIKEQLLKDLNEQKVTQTLKSLRKPILIMHSPQDQTVGIEHAEKLYHAAVHPKSFVSLDGADHLLMDKKDSKYVGEVIAGWSSRYIDIEEDITLATRHNVVASLNNDSLFTTQMRAGNHYFIADEPTSIGGNDFGPNPYELLSSGLAACTVMTIQMYARRKKWLIENVECHVDYDKQHAIDCENCEESSAKIDTFTREIKITGDLDEKQLQRLLQIADKCPVHKTLHSDTQVVTKLVR
ncbi:bifunctional alpha/beta hydrolase/OsmC family protein [Nonlabens ulvanivorans]|uniref:bifunctional alpha/beta hydrolase/OsmC family protein n=1 Tax=Nonlabens ulvanivorans TaxID=906888 RepID=UPI002943A4A0|nr:bifunctional alpha/beta hydrolase/OsmC family protein [Nonlabens ulvanivorans]WOI23363.1 bifunctional alpha/beta hydrolase/OsmC family protein [Nonlabens ulvanivorans]